MRRILISQNFILPFGIFNFGILIKFLIENKIYQESILARKFIYFDEDREI